MGNLCNRLFGRCLTDSSSTSSSSSSSQTIQNQVNDTKPKTTQPPRPPNPPPSPSPSPAPSRQGSLSLISLSNIEFSQGLQPSQTKLSLQPSPPSPPSLPSKQLQQPNAQPINLYQPSPLHLLQQLDQQLEQRFARLFPNLNTTTTTTTTTTQRRPLSQYLSALSANKSLLNNTSVVIKDEKKSQIQCIGCNEKIAIDHAGIKCLQNHNICVECSKNYINLIFSEPQYHMPPKCPECKTEILINTIERQLTKAEHERFTTLILTYVLADQLCGNGEMIVHCPFCNFAEIRQSNGLNFVFCQKCKKRSCFYCYKECEYNKDEDEGEGDDSNRRDSNDSEDSDEYEEKNARKHFECAVFYPLKRKIEKAIEEGAQVSCPKCKTSGRKDDACTHMTCVKCNVEFCYFCGLSVDVCDKIELGENVPTIFGHNADWETNEKRCPMYLSMIHEVDERWSGDEDVCLDFFHRIRVLVNLRKVFEEEKLEDLKRLEEKYKCIANANLSFEEILQEDLTFIVKIQEDREDDNLLSNSSSY